MNSMRIAASGMQAQELNVEVISHNIANMRTTGYKRMRAEFQDLLYLDLKRPGATASDTDSTVPTGIQIGYGVKTGATSRTMSQGNLEQTGKDLDLAIRGEGFFIINRPDGTQAYSRDGSFEIDAEGRIVTLDGLVLEPEITIPENARSISISQTGIVEVTLDGQAEPQELGQIRLARFLNPAGLQAIGDNLYLETLTSGTPEEGFGNEEGFGALMQRFLEASNVNAVSELTDLIAAQRAYEMNTKVISASDDMLSSTTSILR
jgi:flagellar basal-body rod protein FlgG